MNRILGIVYLTIIIALGSGCVTTNESELEQWDPKERAEAHVKLGMIYLTRNQYDTARKEFDLALEINPQSDAVYHAKALLQTKLGNNGEATRFFAKAVSLNRSNYSAVNDYGIHLCQQGQTEEGINQLNRIDADTANDQLLATKLGLGVCYFRDQDYSISEKYLRYVLEQSPTIPQALLPMAEINYAQENFLTARAFLERYFGVGAISERSLYLAAMVEIELGDTIKANQYRRELKRRYPLSDFNSVLEPLLQE
jgi:type IV pilus assembly protein PilF